MEAIIKICDTCIYFERVEEKVTGICRRYPASKGIKVYKDKDWCGEYVEEVMRKVLSD